MKNLVLFIGFAFGVFACTSSTSEVENPEHITWRHYQGDNANTLYSSLDQINKSNVHKLEVAWKYSSKDAREGAKSQCNPLIVKDKLFAISPDMQIFCLNSMTGEEIWSVKPIKNVGGSRGLMYWEDGSESMLLTGAGQYIVALDPYTGDLIKGFGENGKLDLKKNFDRDVSNLTIKISTPGVIYKDLIIQGFMTSEGLPAAPGHIRAYNVRTGEWVWTFKTVPQPGEFGHDTWPENAWVYTGGVNNWAGMALDEENGIVYVPTGSAAFDFWGGDRVGDNLFANSIIALDASTGKRIWHYQTIHHDIWDRDLPAPPNLLTVNSNGESIPALAQITKTGNIFLFNRLTGEPLFEIEEKPVPKSTLNGESASPTQPVPIAPPPFSRQKFTRINPNSVDRDSLQQVLDSINSDGTFEPPSLKGTLIYPGFDGGAEWGGAGIDPETGWLYVNASEMPWVLTMIDNRQTPASSLFEQGQNVYQTFCMGCHGANLEGSTFHGNATGLKNIALRMNQDSVRKILEMGRNEMLAFGYLTNAQKSAVIAYLYQDTVSAPLTGEEIAWGSPYSHTGYIRFVDRDGFPAIEPPWGTLTAINLNEGTIEWQVPLGDYEGMKGFGTENYGGPVVTAGGLVFIAATKDKTLRAFDKQTGEIIWSYELPFDGMATPATYEVDGKQYLVIAATGGKISENNGDIFIAFALPD